MKESMTLNREAAMERLQGDRELFQAMAKFFREDHEALLENLKSASGEQDVSQAAQDAHALKSLAASIGGERVATAAAEIEAAAKANHVAELERQVAKLDTEVSKLLNALNSPQNTGSSLLSCE